MILLAIIVIVAIAVAGSALPVLGRALALRRRLQKLSDNQLFVALGAAHTAAESLPRSTAALQAQIAALTRAVQSVREAIRMVRGTTISARAHDAKSSWAALLDLLC